MIENGKTNKQTKQTNKTKQQQLNGSDSCLSKLLGNVH